MNYDLDHQEIRESVARLCADFPGEYWRKCDREQAYPKDFVDALTGAGFLGALVPEDYGGSGLPISAAAAVLEEIHRAGCNAGACHAQMYTMGTLLRHGSEANRSGKVAAGDRGAVSLRLQAFRRDRADQRHRHHSALRTTTARRDGDTYVVNGQKVWTSPGRSTQISWCCWRAPRPRTRWRSSEGLSVLLVDMREARGKALTIRPIRTMMNHATTEVFFDDMPVPAENLIGEEGRGFRYILSGMNAERILIAAECHRRCKMVHRKSHWLMPRNATCSTGRSARTRASSSPSPRPMRRAMRAGATHAAARPFRAV